MVGFWTPEKTQTPRSVLRLVSVLYGSGAVLTLSEFAFWLSLEDVYWSPEGRASIDAGDFFGAVLLAGIGGMPFLRALVCEWLRAARMLRSIGRRTRGTPEQGAKTAPAFKVLNTPPCLSDSLYSLFINAAESARVNRG